MWLCCPLVAGWLSLFQQAEAEVVDSMRVAVAELTNRLKDKESVINELSEQRAKLENYTKKTLHAVQTKYMVAVSSHRNQLNEKQERVDVLEKKLKEMRTSYSREQALLMSSFYEVRLVTVTGEPTTGICNTGLSSSCCWLELLTGLVVLCM